MWLGQQTWLPSLPLPRILPPSSGRAAAQGVQAAAGAGRAVLPRVWTRAGPQRRRSAGARCARSGAFRGACLWLEYPCTAQGAAAQPLSPNQITLLPCSTLRQMSEEGISACYVNSHSFVHDIVTLSQVGPWCWAAGCGSCTSLPVLLSCLDDVAGMQGFEPQPAPRHAHRCRACPCAGVGGRAAGGQPRDAAFVVPRCAAAASHIFQLHTSGHIGCCGALHVHPTPHTPRPSSHPAAHLQATRGSVPTAAASSTLGGASPPRAPACAPPASGACAGRHCRRGATGRAWALGAACFCTTAAAMRRMGMADGPAGKTRRRACRAGEEERRRARRSARAPYLRAARRRRRTPRSPSEEEAQAECAGQVSVPDK